MRNKAFETVKKYNMLQKGDRVVVGLSGGADSCALLYFLVSLRSELSLTVYACHINHGLRGEDADSDEKYCRRLCQSLGIELFVLHADIKKLSSEQGIGTEQCGRNVRYSFFTARAEELHAKIATAHTASDNAETVLFNLTRGSGIRGICGIPPVRDNIIRPLIECTRDEIEEYCKKNNLGYVTDKTNFERDYNRNKLRLDVMPVLRQINPSVEQTISAFCERMRETELFISECAEKLLINAHTENGYEAEKLKNASPPVFAAAVKILLKKYDIIPDSRHIELIRDIVYNGGAVEIKQDIMAVVSQGLLRVYKKSTEDSSEIIYKGQDSVIINNIIIKPRLLNISDFNKCKENKNLIFHYFLDYDTIPLTPVFRNRREGDFFRPVGKNITKRLRKYMNELRLPSEIRNFLPLLTDGSEILWGLRIGVSDRCKITAKTKRVLLIETESVNEDGNK